jgi:AraC family transcriptional regulator of adaptative response/methylated-DNA-[protein]-cysteine methyltransferase
LAKASKIEDLASATANDLAGQQIPPASTANCIEIAAKIGTPITVRAVAQACGANALAIAIPCHRVIRNDGSLSGHLWGVEWKRPLLETEAHA